MIWRPRSSSAACAGRRCRIDLGQRGTQGAVEVAAAQERQHVVLVDRLALAVAQEGGFEPGAGVQLDLAVAAAFVDVEEDHQAVVEALAADVPLVHERARPRLGLRLARRAAQQLAEDHDLGAGPRLDPVDDRLGVHDRVRREEAGVVVDRPVGLRVRERRTGRRRVLGRRLARPRVHARRGRQRPLGDLRQAGERRAIEVAGGTAPAAWCRRRSPAARPSRGRTRRSPGRRRAAPGRACRCCRGRRGSPGRRRCRADPRPTGP